ncbi:hypothetical protein [Streptomyces cylindrosporus]|uniref:Uncharacterized protein n=1 Tax=Streptomyces cylindrosporus TaxID=2927583 RepID=A0ABS9YD51_9ACTN|nr:hypothetical protein [Streptomyces cylindrosporus]MCI3275149.1 hypothetical protein [Streptomyces cylindrosporus]
MLTETANGDSSRLSRWLRVREFAVPPSMIETATARRLAGDWAGACAAARVDVDLDLRSVARTHGRDLAARLRDDLRHLAPDLLRWHMPRVAPDGLLRPGLTVALARYDRTGPDGQRPDGHAFDGPGSSDPRPVHLVVRTPPAWADAGQRMSLGVWDGSLAERGACRHPHPRPNARFRLDLHRHLWDVRRTDELRARSGADRPTGSAGLPVELDVPRERPCAVDRWPAEAEILLRAEGRAARRVLVRVDGRNRLVLDLAATGGGEAGNGPGASAVRIARASADAGAHGLPVLPDAATWVLPDLELLRSGLIEADRLHPLVATALVPGCSPTGPARSPDLAGQPHFVECRGATHRIALVGGVLAPLDHDPAEVRREELLAALSGTPLPCLQAIDQAHRRPDCLAGVRERLDHGDTEGALAVVEGLLGPEAMLRDGPLRDELEAAAERRIAYGLFRAGLVGPGPDRIRPGLRRPAGHRSHPRHTAGR